MLVPVTVIGPHLSSSVKIHFPAGIKKVHTRDKKGKKGLRRRKKRGLLHTTKQKSETKKKNKQNTQHILFAPFLMDVSAQTTLKEREAKITAK